MAVYWKTSRDWFNTRAFWIVIVLTCTERKRYYLHFSTPRILIFLGICTYSMFTLSHKKILQVYCLDSVSSEFVGIGYCYNDPLPVFFFMCEMFPFWGEIVPPVGRSGLSTWKYQFSYDHWSKATLSSVSTWMGHCSSVAWVLLLTLKVG